MPQEPLASTLPTTLAYGRNWYSPEGAADDSWRWAKSPAELILTSPITQNVTLEIMIFTLYTPPERNDNYQSRLQVETNTGFQTVVNIDVGEMATIPLELTLGRNNITLNLEAGNSHPSSSANDPRMLSFAIRYINLRTH
jgi:hypothetical protein